MLKALPECTTHERAGAFADRYGGSGVQFRSRKPLGEAIAVWIVAGLPGVGLESALARRLPSEERRRAAAVRNSDAREQFLASRIALRSILSMHGGSAGWNCVLGRSDGGRMCATGVAASVSISHSYNMFACALSGRVPVGIDIECIREERAWLRRSTPALTRLFALGGTSAEIEEETCYRWWTCNEALWKAGVTHRLLSWEELQGLQLGGAQTMDGMVTALAANWRLSLVEPGIGWSGAVAYGCGAEIAAVHRISWRGLLRAADP